MPAGDVTIADLAGLSSDLRYELIDGCLVSGSRTPIEQGLVTKVLQAIDDGCPQDLLAVHSQSLSFDDRNELRPAAVVIDPRRGNAERSPVPVEDAVLVVDFLAPDGRFRDLAPKAAVYAAAKVPHWWVVGPLPDGVVAITESRLRDGFLQAVRSADGVFTTAEPFPVTVDLPALTSWQSEKLRRVRAPQ